MRVHGSKYSEINRRPHRMEMTSNGLIVAAFLFVGAGLLHQFNYALAAVGIAIAAISAVVRVIASRMKRREQLPQADNPVPSPNN
jgi:hypothetical protein